MRGGPGLFARLLRIAACAALLAPAAAHAQASGRNVLYSVDFSQQPDGSAINWLKQNHFVLGLDAEELRPRFENHRLVISTDGKIAGLFGIRLDGVKNLEQAQRVEIEWGVSRHPEGADWEKGNNRVALAVMILFGTEKISSGLPFGLNSAPYFLCPFVTKSEPPDRTYLGRLYKKGGRYFSVAAPSGTTDLFTTDFEVRERFRKAFNLQTVPTISALAFQMNTKDTTGGAVAFIRRITILGQ